MKIRNIQWLLAGLVFGLSSCTYFSEKELSSVSKEQREASLKKLTDVLQDTLKWEKVHAAEYLLKLQYTDEVRQAFDKEESKLGQEPVYRIGIWRVLAQSSGSERGQWLQHIESAYQDLSGSDRIHAAESLAKLGYPFKLVKDEKDSAIKVFNKWAQATTSEPQSGNYKAELLSIITSETSSLREKKLAAYGLRNVGSIGSVDWSRLTNEALKKKTPKGLKTYLLSAAFVTAPKDSLSGSRGNEIRKELLNSTQEATAAEWSELGIALAERGTKADYDKLSEDFRKQNRKFSLSQATDIQSALAYSVLRIDRRNQPSLTVVDWLVIVLYGALMLGIGWYYSKQNKTREDYLLGGRKMNPVAVGISLFATLLSTLSYLSYPGEMIQHGPVIFAGMFAFPFVYYVAGWWLIPRIMKENVTSAYEILERRFGVWVRMMATFMFLFLRFLWMATIIYVTVDVALFSVVPFDPSYSLPIGITLMVITIIYTAMGGLKAVVVTDVLQSVIFLGGAFLSILVVCFHFGSLTSWFPSEWPLYWKPPRLGIDIQERSTVGNATLMLFVWYICTIGSDQMAVQRYMATKDIKAARKSLSVSLYTNLLAKCLLGLVGLAVLAFFTTNPHLLSDGSTIKQQADTLFPRFILVGLPSGLSGLVVAGLLAAAMSSLSSGINSVSSVISEDIIQRFRTSKSGADALLRQVKMLSSFTGGLVIVMSIFIGNVEGNLFDIVTKVVNLFVGPLFVLFFMALFVPFATTIGTILGGVASVTTAMGIAFWGIFGITIFWMLPMSLLAGVLVGTVMGFFGNKM